MPYLLLVFLLTCVSSLSGQRTVAGRVVDARTDEPLPYASVIVSGTTVGTVTSPAGEFSLVLPPAVTASAQLEVSYVGYRKQTIAVDTLIQLLVRLEPEASPLDILPEVRARRSPIALNDRTPAASLRLPDIYALAPEGLLLTQAIDGLPGVQVQSAALNTNRLSIRGIGARTPFSTDQVRIYWNDIPLTNGVGESALDDLEPGVAGVLTVWRGPSPAFTGSNLGGAIQLEQQPFQGAGLRLSAGDFGRRQVLTRVGFSPTTNWQTDLMYARTHTDGYRDNNRFDRTSLTWTGAITDGGGGKTSYLAHYRGLEAQIPSSLSRMAYESDPRQAAGAWGAVRAGEDQDNLLLGLTHERPLGRVENRTSLFGGTRTNDEVRPFGVLVEDSRFGGLRTRFSRPAGPGEVELGGELFGERYEQDNFETLDDGSAGDPIGSHDEDRWYYFSYLGWRPAHTLQPPGRAGRGGTGRRAFRRTIRAG